MKPEKVEAILKAEEFVMPFGVHKGKKLEDLPTSYLRWAAENMDIDRVATKCDLVLQGR